MMISTFRKIRRQLLLEGRLQKYMAYAFGEIALIVIGILIALQVNNWNTIQDQVALSDTTRHALRAELITAKHSLTRGLSFNRTRYDQGIRLIKGAISETEIQANPADIFLMTGYAAFELQLPIAERELTSDTKIRGMPELTNEIRSLMANYQKWLEVSEGMDAYWRSEVATYFAANRLMIHYAAMGSGGDIDPQIATTLYHDEYYQSHVAFLNLYLRSLIQNQASVLENIDSLLASLPPANDV